MATLTATAASSVVSPKLIHSGSFVITGGPFSFTPSAGDVVQMLKVPSGFTPTEVLLQASSVALSVGGTVTTILTVGDGNVAARYISASVNTTAVVRMGTTIVTPMLHTYTANDTIDVTIGASTGTDSASKTITLALIVHGTVDA